DNSLLLEKAKDRGNVDSGCSRSMSGNKDKLEDFEDFDGGEVIFGGSIGKISGKGTIKTKTLNFKNVLYVEELQHFNLISVSQISDQTHWVLFTKNKCLVLSKDFPLPDLSMVILSIPRKHNLYTPKGPLTCLIAKASQNESTLLHRRLGHVNFKNINKLVKGNLVRGLPPKVFQNNHTCVTCNKGKQHKASYKAIPSINLITEPLHSLHMDLFGPTSVRSINNKYYCFFITDEYTRFSWVYFLEHKSDTFLILKNFITLVENQFNHKVKAIRCNNGTEFKNANLIEFCGSKGIRRDYSNAKTPQQNEVAERKHQTLIEAARTMLADSLLPTIFWSEAVATACYVLNQVLVTKPHHKTPNELLTRDKPSISYLKPFGCHVTILNTSDPLGKFNKKSDKGYIVGYSISSKAYKVYNLVSRKIEETMNLKFLKNKPFVARTGQAWMFDIDYLTDSLNYSRVSSTNLTAGSQGATPSDADNLDELTELQALQRQEQAGKEEADQLGLAFPSLNLILGVGSTRIGSSISACSTPPVSAGSTPLMSPPTGSAGRPVYAGRPSGYAARTPITTDIHDGLKLFDCSKSGIFTSSSYDEEFFGPDANNLESSLDVCSTITKRIHNIHPTSQVLGDINSPVQTRSQAEIQQFRNRKVWVLVTLPDGKRAIGIKWILKNKRDARGIVCRNKVRLVAQGHRQVEGIDYTDVFASVARIKDIRLFLAFVSFIGFKVYQMDMESAFLYEKIAEESEFEMSSMGPLTFFLGLQVDQRTDGIFIHQEKYVVDILKKFDLDNPKLVSTPFEPQKIREKNVPDEPISVHLYRSMIGCLIPDMMFVVCAAARHQVTPKTSNLLSVKRIFKYLTTYPKLGLWYPRDSLFDLEAFFDSDYVGAHGDRKSTTGGCQFLRRRGFCCLRPILLVGKVSAGGHSFLLVAVVSIHFCWSCDFLLVVPHSYWCLGFCWSYVIPAGLRDIGYTTKGKFTFFKNKFSPQWKFLIHTLIHCHSPKSGSWNQFACNIAIALICLSTGRKYNFSNMTFNGMFHNVSSRTKFLMYPRFIQLILDTDTEDTTPYPAPLSSPPPIPFGPAHSFGVVSTEPIPDIPSSSRPFEPVLETITSPVRDDDTGGGSFHESPPHPPPTTPPRSPTVGVAEEPLTLTSLLALFPTCLQRIATLEAELKATRILHRNTVNEEEARQSQELDTLLDLANAALHEPNFTNAAIPAGDLDSAGGVDSAGGLVSAAGADSAGGLVSAAGADSAGGLTSAGILVAAGPTVIAEPSSPIRDPFKGKVVATPSSPISAPTAKELSDQQAAILEAERQELLEQELKQSIDAKQVYLDSLVALNLTNEEWISLVDQVKVNPTLSAELLGADVSGNTFSVRKVELMNRQRKMIAKMKAKAKREKPMTPAQQKEFMRTFVKNQTKYHHQRLKMSGETLESLESKKFKSSHSTTQPVELQKTTSVSAGSTIVADDPIPAVTSVFAATSIPAATPIPAVVSITAGASGSASEASVPIIELLDSPPKETSLQLDPESKEQDVLLRKSSRKKSIARKRTLPSPFKPKSDALPFDKDDPEAEFKRYLRQASNDDEPAEPVSLTLVSDITSWEILPTEFGHGEIHVITRADGTVKRFSTLRELMYWAGRADLMVLYGLVLDKYKTERATGIFLGLWSDLRILITSREERDASIIWDDPDHWQIRSWRFYALPAIHVLKTEAGDIMYTFVDKKYPLTLETIQRMLNHGLEIDRDPSGSVADPKLEILCPSCYSCAGN
nr:putative ribonuclease H-like domain-containing protein [Tanacetum cinerariifolium]